MLSRGALPRSLFDDRDMASITAPDFPGERLVVCRNGDLAADRQRKRQALLDATERELRRIQTAVGRKREPLRGTAAIALKVGAVLDQYKMAKHVSLEIADTHFSFARKEAEAATEGSMPCGPVYRRTSSMMPRPFVATNPSPRWNGHSAA